MNETSLVLRLKIGCRYACASPSRNALRCCSRAEAACIKLKKMEQTMIVAIQPEVSGEVRVNKKRKTVPATDGRLYPKASRSWGRFQGQQRLSWLGERLFSKALFEKVCRLAAGSYAFSGNA